jgi:MarR family transcriptional regulator for hemolysin
MKKSFKVKHGEQLRSNPAFQITEVARLYRTTFDKKMKALGLDRSHWWLISFLCYFEGSTQQELAEVMDIGKAGLGKLVDRVEKEGLVKRTPDQTDRRLNRVRLTATAKPLAAKIMRDLDETMRISLSTVTPAELRTFNNVLKKIKTSLTAC